MNNFFFIILMLIGFIQPTLAQGSRYEKDHSIVRTDLLSAYTALGDKKEILMGLRFKLQPTWKIYAPAVENSSKSFTVPPQISWKNSINIGDIKIIWPPSHSYKMEGLSYQAYEKEVIIPLRVQILDPKKPLTLNLELNYSVCSNACIPMHEILTHKIDPGTALSTSHTTLLEKLSNPSPKDVSYLLMLACAFLGGFILNFMPCVLPVLSLKIVGIAKGGARLSSPINFRPRFLATFAGIMFSFTILGAIAVFLDNMGTAIGWGLHFQQPSFLIFLIVITTLFSNNLWGFFDIELPLFLRQMLSKSLGYEHKHQSLLAEDFIAGMLATLLATPCTAPFLGTALGYAFSRSGLEILLFFMVLGLGFSTPYWAGALLPQSWIKVPKPGLWMEKLSKGMGGVLALTTLWLLWILSESSSATFIILLGSGIVVMSMIFKLGQKRPALKKLNWLVAALMLLSPWMKESCSSISVTNAATWHVFEPEKIPKMIEEGKIVVVDITAAWCLTCKLNKYLVLESKEGNLLLSKNNIIRMQADWTQQDSRIASYLATYGRAGIPFNIIFGPRAAEGIVLPELLTLQRLKEVLTQAE